MCGCRIPLPGAADGSDLSLDREREITEGVASQIREGAPLINDPVLLAYLDELGQAIVAATGDPAFYYRFSIIDDPALNAFTIGGGHVYVHSGVLSQAAEVSEIAGVLAHEIAHVQKRHIARRQEGQGLTTLLTLAAMAAVAAGGLDPEVLIAAQGLNVALQLRNSRSAETEADYEGVQYLVRAGYAPRGMTRFFERILAEGGKARSAAPSYLFTHPDVEERIATTRGQIARMELPDGLRTRDAKLAEMQTRLALLRTTIAGGSGLLARASFDRELTEPALSRAEELRKANDPTGADAVLAEIQRREPADPRVAMLRAQLAEQTGDLVRARDQLTVAVELDPTVPLAQYELGRMHALLGDRRRALFFLDRASVGARRGSSLRSKIEREIQLVVFSTFEDIRMTGLDAATHQASPGTTLSCEVRLHPIAVRTEAPLVARWRDAAGKIRHEETFSYKADRPVLARYVLPDDAQAGPWSIELRMGETQRQERHFRVSAPMP